MGAGQSTSGSHSSLQQGQNVKVGYYELLSVDRQATDDEIKKAYRRKALELHPDRNFGDVERTTALFAEIQAAYEVLSDPQERAWYDSHEGAILNNVDVGEGGENRYERSVGITTADDIARLFGRFNGNVEFSDAPSGFFGFLRETFERLANEEEAAASRGGLVAADYPSFGHKDDRHADVVRTFYNAWTGFSTKKTFAWRDRHRTADAQDRRTRRLIEKENKRFRSDAIQEFNDAVRSLVAFVKKRDPRYKPNTQTEAERQEVLRNAAKAQAARMRAANEAKLSVEVPEWTKNRESEDEEEEEESSGEESEEEHFECVACRKTFKSENQFEAHEKSKKHNKAVTALRRKLQEEGQSFDLEDEGESITATKSPSSLMDDDASSSELSDGTPSKSRKASLSADSDVETLTSQMQSLEPDGDGGSDTLNSDEDHPSDNQPRKESFGTEESLRPIPDDNEVPMEQHDSKTQPKRGKAAQKRAKKAAQEADTDAEQRQKCTVCGTAFPSRTRLFQHIKDFGHGAPVAKAKGGMQYHWYKAIPDAQKGTRDDRVHDSAAPNGDPALAGEPAGYCRLNLEAKTTLSLWATIVTTVHGQSRTGTYIEPGVPTGVAVSGNYTGDLRPQVHFSPPKIQTVPVLACADVNTYFVDDATGLVAGNQHWGHSTSKDLYHWENQGIALYAINASSYIFTGSAVIDTNNTSGFFPSQDNGVVAMFTIDTEEPVSLQTQGIAYSKDGGYTFIMYEDNPVIDIGSAQFRDPKVVRYGDHWAAVISYAQEATLGIFTSTNLKEWTHASNFSHQGLLGLQYECPNLVEVPVEDSSDTVWLLQISINPGAPQGGSAMQYFLGDFDGYTFIKRDEVTRLTGFGKDEYAGQYFYGTSPREAVVINWANNWQYVQVTPTDVEGWRSVMGIPRSITIRNATRVGTTQVARPYKSLAPVIGERLASETMQNGSMAVDFSSTYSNAVYLTVNVTNIPSANASGTMNFTFMSPITGEYLRAGQFFVGDQHFFIDRGGCRGFDNVFFTDKFSTTEVLDSTWSMQAIFDRSIFETFLDDGALASTTVLYSEQPLTLMTFAVSGLPAGNQTVRMELYALNSAWKQYENTAGTVLGNVSSSINSTRARRQQHAEYSPTF
ncbi:MAG: hypothetical protein M1828_003660 [Chrysothrix sp. TS-e1954]|nr:MAG: hypothetical protein M1828_003660 [Chrysothrix sp. TS-e1954]